MSSAPPMTPLGRYWLRMVDAMYETAWAQYRRPAAGGVTKEKYMTEPDETAEVEAEQAAPEDEAAEESTEPTADEAE